MSTPYLDEAERCSRIVLLHEGRLLALDQPSRLRSELPGTLLEVLVESPGEALQRLGERSQFTRAQVFGDRLHAWIDASDPASAERVFRQAAERASVEIDAIRPIRPSLEDVFIAQLSTIPETATS